MKRRNSTVEDGQGEWDISATSDALSVIGCFQREETACGMGKEDARGERKDQAWISEEKETDSEARARTTGHYSRWMHDVWYKSIRSVWLFLMNVCQGSLC